MGSRRMGTVCAVDVAQSFFFFSSRRRHTRFDCDWSSDVCSSDLLLLQTMGTPWEVELDGSIFFFEDYEAPAWYVDGMLTQLAHAGKLERVAGVVVGDMERCEWREERPEWPRTRSIEDVLELHLEPLGVPVIYKLPLGHGKH